MSAILDRWDGAQRDRLAEFRQSVTDRSMLLRLLETTCLLELSRLACAQPGLVLYARLGLELVCDFFPLEHCVLVIDAPDLPPVRVSHGSAPAASPATLEFVLRAAGEPVGVLSVSGALGGATPEILASVAEQFSAALGAVTAAEQLRRRAGAAEAHRTAAALAEGPDGSRLEELALSFSRLPGVVGAEIRWPLAGGEASSLRAGLVGDGPESEFAVSLGEPGAECLVIRVEWSEAPAAGDLEMAADVAATVGRALAGWNETRRLREEAETDPLTELPNRRRAWRELAAALSRAERFAEGVAVLAIDLDHFKRVNDTLGHDAGDTVLRSAATGLRLTSRGYDVAARIGGEEFLLVCPATTPEAAEAIASRLLVAVTDACAAALPEGWNQTASVGIANYPANGSGAAQLLRAADDALYAAKRAGRNGWAVAAPPATARRA